MRRSLMAEMLVLLAASLVLGAAVNLWRPEPLPWIADIKVPQTPPPVVTPASPSAAAPAPASPSNAIPAVLTPQQAAPLSGAAGVLFIDARTPEEFAAGHVPGAVNLPYETIFGDLAGAAKAIPGDAALVVYCGDELCPKSKELAESLKALGRSKVSVMPAGMAGWTAAGNPTESGQ